MDSQISTGAPVSAKRMTKKEFLAEADRLLRETGEMLRASERSLERARRTGQANRRALEELEQRLSCGNG